MALGNAEAIVFVAVVCCLVVVPIEAADHTVGGSSGWESGRDYSSWAADESFAAGDMLTFNYNGFHSVFQVRKSEYESCSTQNAVQSDSSGSTSIKLQKPSTTYYFICGTPGHCAQGMKLSLTTASSSSPSSLSSSSSSPESSSSSKPSSSSSTSGYLMRQPPHSSSTSGAIANVVKKSGFCVHLMGLVVLVMLG